MNLVPCMGGWCRSRNACAHHYAQTLPDRDPVERLCAKGVDEPAPVRWMAQEGRFSPDRGTNEAVDASLGVVHA
jgi:hypothetical protein